MDLTRLTVLTAKRTKVPTIRVVQLTPPMIEELLRQGMLTATRFGYRVATAHNKNPAAVNPGDYLRVDDPADVYPIAPGYVADNFEFLDTHE